MSSGQSLSLEAVIFVIILIMYVLTSHLIQIRNIPYCHESVVAIIMGLLTAIFAKYALKQEFNFSSQFFFTIILPAIIFAAGYSLRKSFFFENFAIIAYLGLVATILAFIVISCLLVLVNGWFNNLLTIKQVLLLSAIFCATDTIAANSLIKPQKYPTLHAVLFSEGIFNDATAIILFRTVDQLEFGPDGGFSFGIVFSMLLSFCYLLFFSLLLGAVTGLGLSYLMKINESFMTVPIKEASLILLNGYLTYLIGEICGLSGIIALFTCAIIMGHYCFQNISQESQRGTGLAFETVAFIAEAFIYAYLGASILSLQAQWQSFVLALILILFIPFIRASMVYLLPGIYHLLKKKFPLNPKQLKICWFAGMVRGAIAFALCLQIQSDNEQKIRTITMTLVFITTVLGSSTLKAFATYIGIGKDDDNEEGNGLRFRMMADENSKSETAVSKYHQIGLAFESSEPKHSSESEDGNSEYNRKKKLQELQQKYIKPIFQKKNHDFNYELSEAANKDSQ